MVAPRLSASMMAQSSTNVTLENTVAVGRRSPLAPDYPRSTVLGDADRLKLLQCQHQGLATASGRLAEDGGFVELFPVRAAAGCCSAAAPSDDDGATDHAGERGWATGFHGCFFRQHENMAFARFHTLIGRVQGRENRPQINRTFGGLRPREQSRVSLQKCESPLP